MTKSNQFNTRIVINFIVSMVSGVIYNNLLLLRTVKRLTRNYYSHNCWIVWMFIWNYLEIMLVSELLKEVQFHGSNRLADRRYRFCWAVGLLGLLSSAVTIVLVTVSRYFENPTYMTIMESKSALLKFPGVYICPEVHYPDYKIEEFVAEIRIPPNVNASELRVILPQLAAYYSPDTKHSVRQLKIIEFVLEYNGLYAYDVAKRLTPSCEETVLRCRWLGIIMNCSSLFQMVLNPFGYCCVFNLRSLEREIREYGLHKMAAPSSAYLDVVGPTSGLMVVVNTSQELTNIDLTYKWVALAKGQSFIETGVNGTPVSPNTEHWLGYTMINIFIAEETRQLSADLRGCQLSSEKTNFFPFYSKSNCLVECEMARTIKRCQCVRISHPRPLAVPYCGADKLQCLKNAAVTYDTDQCNCPYTCDTQMVRFVTESFPLNGKANTHDHFYDDLELEKVCVVRAFILQHNHRRFIRSAYFKSYDLFSQLGGVFNVFFGCSILTLLELVQLVMYGIRNRGIRRAQKYKIGVGPIIKKNNKKFVKRAPKSNY